MLFYEEDYVIRSNITGIKIPKAIIAVKEWQSVFIAIAAREIDRIGIKDEGDSPVIPAQAPPRH